MQLPWPALELLASPSGGNAGGGTATARRQLQQQQTQQLTPPSCAFESPHLCGWAAEAEAGQNAWTRGSKTPSGGTGASAAHGGTYFMFLETSAGKPGDASYLTSPKLKLAVGGGSSMSFYYHMFGNTMGVLSVEARIQGKWSTLWTKRGQQYEVAEEVWTRASVALPAGTARVRFKGTKGSSSTGDMSIDSVAFSADVALVGGSAHVAHDWTLRNSVTVAGLRCHPSANAVYTLQPAPLHGKPHWATADGVWQLYWANDRFGKRWYLDTDTDNSACGIYTDSTADAPPGGTWREYCTGKWGISALTLTAPLSAANCAALAAATKALPACAEARTKTCDSRVAHTTCGAVCPPGSDTAVCPLPCAEAWLPARARCAAHHAAAFEAAAGPGLSAACSTTAKGALATAPSSITVAGLTCQPRRNGVYVLQPAPLNARPHYATAGGRPPPLLDAERGSQRER
eukprot:COSAG01_NODE_11590_length_1898_cov_1.226793_1_plen_458_part_01